MINKKCKQCSERTMLIGVRCLYCIRELANLEPIRIQLQETNHSNLTSQYYFYIAFG